MEVVTRCHKQSWGTSDSDSGEARHHIKDRKKKPWTFFIPENPSEKKKKKNTISRFVIENIQVLRCPTQGRHCPACRCSTYDVQSIRVFNCQHPKAYASSATNWWTFTHIILQLMTWLKVRRWWLVSNKFYAKGAGVLNELIGWQAPFHCCQVSKMPKQESNIQQPNPAASAAGPMIRAI